MRLVRAAALLAVLVLAHPPVWALEDAGGADPVDRVMGRYNFPPAFDKLGRGIGNLIGGWMEIPLNIRKHQSSRDTAGSYFSGAAHGLIKGAVRTGVGAYEALTFFIPVPQDFKPILPTLEPFRRPNRPARPGSR
jgi:putative exosortase-associated protein (TIGR04073 family)